MGIIAINSGQIEDIEPSNVDCFIESRDEQTHEVTLTIVEHSIILSFLQKVS